MAEAGQEALGEHAQAAAVAAAAGGAAWPKSDFPAVPPLFASNYFRLSHVFFQEIFRKELYLSTVLRL